MVEEETIIQPWDDVPHDLLQRNWIYVLLSLDFTGESRVVVDRPVSVLNNFESLRHEDTTVAEESEEEDEVISESDGESRQPNRQTPKGRILSRSSAVADPQNWRWRESS